MKLGIIGMGKMGEAVVAGLVRATGGPGAAGASSGTAVGFDVQGTTRSASSAEESGKRLGIRVHTDNAMLVEASEVLLLAVKPHQAEDVLRKIAPKIRKNQVLISICASITTGQLAEWSGGRCAVIRAMPNTPCLIGEGMTVFAPGPGAQEQDTVTAEKIFKPVGRTAIVEESLMDGVTGLSGCGPAYVYLVIEALSEAGVKVGLPRETATLLAAQTLLGASKMVLERGVHPAALKDEVTTPAGCTIDGLMALEEGKLRVTLIKAVLAAAKRSRSLRERK
jgi:pyrroline-5-carboxylate reductase